MSITCPEDTMRLFVIILIGAVFIAGTYFYTNSSRSESKSQSQSAAPLPLLAQGSLPQNKLHPAQLNPTQNTVIPLTAPLQQTSVDTNAATPLDQARVRAKSLVLEGKNDPFAPLADTHPFPGSFELPTASGAEAAGKDKTAGSKKVSKKKLNGELVPPPPSFGDMPPGQLPSGLAFGDLPSPPENQGIASKIALVGIVGDHAIFNFTDAALRRARHWPKTFTLAEGASFDQLRLLSIQQDSVTVEEGGERSTKSLPPVR
jgi:hypothetical protein